MLRLQPLPLVRRCVDLEEFRFHNIFSLIISVAVAVDVSVPIPIRRRVDWPQEQPLNSEYEVPLDASLLRLGSGPGFRGGGTEEEGVAVLFRRIGVDREGDHQRGWERG